MMNRSRVLASFWKTKVDPNGPIKFVRAAQHRPYITKLEQGKQYYWCSCGLSKSQPFCDGAHKAFNTQHNTDLKPIAFKAEATKKYMLCGCKQTGGAPFCDMSHVGVIFRRATGLEKTHPLAKAE